MLGKSYVAYGVFPKNLSDKITSSLREKGEMPQGMLRKAFRIYEKDEVPQDKPTTYSVMSNLYANFFSPPGENKEQYLHIIEFQAPAGSTPKEAFNKTLDEQRQHIQSYTVETETHVYEFDFDAEEEEPESSPLSSPRNN